MKRAYLITVVSMLTIPCLGQHASSTFAASYSDVDRMSMVKSSINIPSWHEKSFWPLYEEYRKNAEAVAVQSSVAIQSLSTITDKTMADEAYSHAENVLALRMKELDVRKQFFAEIGAGYNGIIAMQFLQTEAVLGMMENSSIYDRTRWRKFRFYPHLIKGDESNVKAAKYNTLSKAVELPSESAKDFYIIYASYERECDQLLGEDYSIVGLYAGEPSDYTPGLAKRLGYDLLTIMERELQLKKKYFIRMNDTVGPVLAAKFLAWEDYYSLQNKMLAWSDGSN